MRWSYDLEFVLHLGVASMALIRVPRHKQLQADWKSQLCKRMSSTWLISCSTNVSRLPPALWILLTITRKPMSTRINILESLHWYERMWPCHLRSFLIILHLPCHLYLCDHLHLSPLSSKIFLKTEEPPQPLSESNLQKSIHFHIEEPTSYHT